MRVFVYVNAMLSRPDTRFPRAWYLHDAAGAPVRSLVQGNSLMDPRSTLVYRGVRGWADHVRRTCAAALRAVPTARGCFLDMVGPAPLRPGYNRGHAVPLDPATGRPFSPAAYLAATGALARTVQRATGRPVIANGLESGGHYFHGTAVLGRYVSGLEVEHWMGVGDWQARNPALWRENVQMLIDEGRARRTLLVNLHPPESGASGPWAEFGLASFLLGYTGTQYFQFSLGPGHPSWRTVPPGYGVDIGVPAERHPTVQGYARHGVYERRYTHGLVVVNPSERTVTVTLPGRYELPHGPAALADRAAPAARRGAPRGALTPRSAGLLGDVRGAREHPQGDLAAQQPEQRLARELAPPAVQERMRRRLRPSPGRRSATRARPGWRRAPTRPRPRRSAPAARRLRAGARRARAGAPRPAGRPSADARRRQSAARRHGGQHAVELRALAQLQAADRLGVAGRARAPAGDLDQRGVLDQPRRGQVAPAGLALAPGGDRRERRDLLSRAGGRGR